MKKGHIKDYKDTAQFLTTEENERESVQKDLMEQVAREKENPCEFEYLEKIISSQRGREYKSGTTDGKPVVTYEDYTRLIINESRISQYGKGKGACNHELVRPATVYQVRASGKSLVGDKNVPSSVEPIIASDGLVISHMEKSDTTCFGACRRLMNQWFPASSIIKPPYAERRRMNSAFAGVAWVIIFAIILSLPIVLNTMKLSLISSINDNRSALTRLREEEARLAAEYETSIDLLKIDDYARNELGMVKAFEANVNLLILNENDQVEAFDDKKTVGVLPTLLSALGIRIPE